MADLDGKTENERLFEAGLMTHHDDSPASGDAEALNEVFGEAGPSEDADGINSPVSGEEQPETPGSREKLALRSPSETDAAPALKKKGRGWEISEKRLDALHDRARDMRRHSSPAHKMLAERFAKANLGRYKFTRHAVVGSAILDFNCHHLGMAIAIDEEGQDDALAKRRDKSLEAVGIRVMRIKAADILENIDAVLARITAGMRLRIADKKEAAHAHKQANPRQHYSRARPHRKSDASNR